MRSDAGNLLVVTPGEPAGIGPDITLLAAKMTSRPLVVAADPDLMRTRAAQLGIDIVINDFVEDVAVEPGRLNMVPVPVRAGVIPGKPDPANAPYVIDTLEAAVGLCESGACVAMVTGPVNKAVINDAGIPFSGHTEWLAERTGARHVVMLLATEGLKVALATTHLPLREVADAITPDLLRHTITILHDDLRARFGIARPRILVLGLNPHAGESGHLGREEIDTIAPVIEELSDRYRLAGPAPADTAFTPNVLEGMDAVLAKYHDQGLPVLKFKGFGAAANITLGLDIIRTSVDHGTALDLAGSGRAEPDGLMTAIDYAARMAAHAFD
jgi:4-hydroxythreonine-4-phosphate dehydrogenase